MKKSINLKKLILSNPKISIRQLSKAIIFSMQPQEVSLTEIIEQFDELGIKKPTEKSLYENLRTDGELRNRKRKKFLLSHIGLTKIEAVFEEFITTTSSELEELGDIANLPFLENADYDAAKSMAQIYYATHCFENSLRKFIEKVLVESFGSDWWEKSSNSGLRNKHKNRLAKEKEEKWLPSRSELGPLYSLDWIDLVTLMRKNQDHFKEQIGNIRFLDRIEDIYGIRNVIAHHGVLSDDKQLQRILLTIHDWKNSISE